MSRVSRRAGTKALVCMECQRRVKGASARTVTSFRGKGRGALAAHLREAHGIAKPRV